MRGAERETMTIPQFQALIVRMLDAKGKAERESLRHPDRDRRMYCEGTAHGLSAALGMIEDALAVERDAAATKGGSK